jgi:hypothetical protein
MQDFATTLQKYEERLSKANHVDGKQLAINFLFPLLRKLAGTVGETLAEHDEAISDLEDALAHDGDVLAQARDVIVLLSGLLDETMVAAGFYKTTQNGLEDTGKAPEELRTRFVEAASQVVAVVQAIEEELNGEDEDEIESDGVDGAEADGQREGGDAAAVAVAVAGALKPAAAAQAIEPDAVIEPSSGAAAKQEATDAA